MTRALTQRHAVRQAISGSLLVLATVAVLAVAPAARATGRTHAQAHAVTTVSIAYSLSGQLSGLALAGWLSGSQDSTGLITATVTMADPTTNAPVTANANGRVVGKGSAAAVSLTVTPIPGSKMMIAGGATMTLAGGAVGKAGEWAGTITRGSVSVGSWSLTPQTSTLHIDAGGRSAAKSKDKVALAGALNLGVTASGWADGTFATFDGSATYVVHGSVNGGDVAVTIPWGKGGTIVLIGTIRQVLDHHGWSGNFIGPAAGDYGTWTGQG